MTAALSLSNDSRTTACILLQRGGQLSGPRSALARNRIGADDADTNPLGSIDPHQATTFARPRC
jgi:hypothetical protein